LKRLRMPHLAPAFEQVRPVAHRLSRVRRPRGTRCSPGDLHSGDDTAEAVDAVPGDHVCATGGAACTLRGAIMEANVLPGADDIVRPAGTYALTIPGTVESARATGTWTSLAP
jgi:hypothetical protein